jgi:hypothetical protein
VLAGSYGPMTAAAIVLTVWAIGIIVVWTWCVMAKGN